MSAIYQKRKQAVIICDLWLDQTPLPGCLIGPVSNCGVGQGHADLFVSGGLKAKTHVLDQERDVVIPVRLKRIPVLNRKAVSR